VVVLFANILFSAIRLARGHVRANIVNVILALGACVLIAFGLVRASFPALAISPTGFNAAGAGSNVGPNNAGAGAASAQTGTGNTTRQRGNRSQTGGNANTAGQTGGNVNPAGQTGGQTGGSGSTGQGNNPAGQTGSQTGRSGFNGQRNNQSGQAGNQTGQAGGNANAAPQTGSQGGQAANQAVQTGQGGLAGPAAAGFIPATRLATVIEIAGGITILAGLILYFGERRRQGYVPTASSGLLYSGVGVFVLVAALVIPMLPGEFGVANARGAFPVQVASSNVVAKRASQQSASPTATSTPAPTATEAPTLTPVPSDSPTPLYTAVAYAGSSADANTATTCSVAATTALNLRSDPSTNQLAVGKVFAGSLLPVLQQTADKKWYKVVSADGGTSVEGWVSADFVTALPGCANTSIPVVGSSTGGNAVASTPQKTPNTTAGTICVVVTTTPVSLRPDPSTKHPPVTQIPEKVSLTASGKSTDGGWWHVSYDSQGTSQEGWVGAGAVKAAASCSALPVVMPASS
jgi:uncharacterized protein YraI